MPHPHLVVETSPAGYRWVRLSRPERRNALDVSLLRAVTDALAAEPGVPVLLASADPRVFCAGADLTITDAERAAVSDLVGRAAAMDLVLTGRWLEAAEALALGLVNRVCEDPEPTAAQIAADLAGRGTGAAGAGVKAVMAAGGLLDRMRAERAANRSAWSRVLAGQ